MATGVGRMERQGIVRKRNLGLLRHSNWGRIQELGAGFAKGGVI